MDGEQVDMQVVPTSSAFLFPFTIVIQLSSFLFWQHFLPLLQIPPEALSSAVAGKLGRWVYLLADDFVI